MERAINTLGYASRFALIPAIVARLINARAIIPTLYRAKVYVPLYVTS